MKLIRDNKYKKIVSYVNIRRSMGRCNLENTTNIYQARTRGVVASAHDGIVCISGLDNGEVVKFYAADGKLIGSSSAVDGTASCAVSETMVIAKFGDNAIKVAVK